MIFSENGIIHASVLIDGFVRASWKLRTAAPGPSHDVLIGEVLPG